MRTFKTKWFHRWAAKEGLPDSALLSAVLEMESGLVDANLGGHIMKKRVALPSRGKRGSTRTLVAYLQGNTAFFLYGFAKNERTDIGRKELKALKLLADQYLNYRPTTLNRVIKTGELLEVSDND